MAQKDHKGQEGHEVGGNGGRGPVRQDLAGCGKGCEFCLRSLDKRLKIIFDF